MKKKILGIFVFILLIATVIPAVGTANDNVEMKKETHDLIQPDIARAPAISSWWLEEEKLTALDGEECDYFSSSISLDGDYAIVGAVENDEKGSAYIFKRSGTTWIQEAKLTASDGITGNSFGQSVSIDGEYSIVGDCWDNDRTGAAYVFKRSGTTWTQEAKLTASDGDENNWFGFSVSFSGVYVIIGAVWDDDNGEKSGSAYIFKNTGTTWEQEAKLTASDGESEDRFGWSVSLDGEYAIVGAPWNNGITGAAYVFNRSGTTWIQEEKLTASDGVPADYFGRSVSIDSEIVIVGAPHDDDNGLSSGSAYVFKRSGTTWIQEAKLTASDGATNNWFGGEVTIDYNIVIVGSTGDDENGIDSGSAYVFNRSGTTWTQEAKLTASDVATDDRFGSSVSIDKGYAVIGAIWDDNHTGSAYIFKRVVPDLDCVGSLSWTRVPSGGTVTGDFVIVNNGDTGSELDWEITEWSSWGDWTFAPSSGTSLTPAMGTVTVYVEVVAPNEKNQEFNGTIKVVNCEDSNDYDTIPVYLKTPVNQQLGHPLLQKILNIFPNAFPILQHLLEL